MRAVLCRRGWSTGAKTKQICSHKVRSHLLQWMKLTSRVSPPSPQRVTAGRFVGCPVVELARPAARKREIVDRPTTRARYVNQAERRAHMLLTGWKDAALRTVPSAVLPEPNTREAAIHRAQFAVSIH